MATTKPQTQTAADKAAELAQATADTKAEALATAIAKRFAPLSGGEWAEYSAQVRYAETVLVQILDALDIQGFDGNTVAIQIETGKYARCYGRNTMMKRLDNGKTVVSVVIHISSFSLSLDKFVLNLLHAVSHTLAFTSSAIKVEYGVSMGGQHNAAFRAQFSKFGTLTDADRSATQNLPVELKAETKSVIDRLTLDRSAVILTADVNIKPKRESATVLRLACPTDAAHFATSNIEKRYKGKRPIIDLKCGKCDAKISVAGYAKHAETK
jgi:hypothetical protein